MRFSYSCIIKLNKTLWRIKKPSNKCTKFQNIETLKIVKINLNTRFPQPFRVNWKLLKSDRSHMITLYNQRTCDIRKVKLTFIFKSFKISLSVQSLTLEVCSFIYFILSISCIIQLSTPTRLNVFEHSVKGAIPISWWD